VAEARRTRTLLERSGLAAPGRVVGRTLHAVAWLVRLHVEPLGLPQRLSVFDADDAPTFDLVREKLCPPIRPLDGRNGEGRASRLASRPTRPWKRPVRRP
jgi:hypothetical protein